VPQKLLDEFGDSSIYSVADETTSLRSFWAWCSHSIEASQLIGQLEEESESPKDESDNSFIFDFEIGPQGASMVEFLNACSTRWKFENDCVQEIQAIVKTDWLQWDDIPAVMETLGKYIVFGVEELSLDVRDAIIGTCPEASRIKVEKLCGGFSGACVFKATTFNFAGDMETPTVLKTDSLLSTEDESKRMEDFSRYLGENAPKLISRSACNEIGALRLELCGATWCLPSMEHTAPTISTFKDLYKAEIFRTPQVSMLKKQSTNSRFVEGHVSLNTFGEIGTVLGEVFGSILAAGATDKAFYEPSSIFTEGCYDLRALIKKHLVNNQSKNVQEMYTGTSSSKLVKEWTSITTGMNVQEYFTRFLRSIDVHLQNSTDHKRLMGFVHGDLNGANILIDSETIVWIIDFAFSGKGAILEDICKLESTILLEYTPINGVASEDFSKLVQALITADVSEELPMFSSLQCDLSKQGLDSLEQAWSAISRMRQHAITFMNDDFNPLYLHTGRLFHAIKALSFQDTCPVQKEFAMKAALGHADQILQCINGKSTLSTEEVQTNHCKLDISIAIEMLKREKLRYMTNVAAKDAYFVDPISRSKLNVLHQCVNLSMVADADEETLDSRSKPFISKETVAHAITEALEYFEEFCNNVFLKSNMMTEDDLQNFASTHDGFQSAMKSIGCLVDEKLIHQSLFKYVDFGADFIIGYYEHEIKNIFLQRLINTCETRPDADAMLMKSAMVYLSDLKFKRRQDTDQGCIKIKDELSYLKTIGSLLPDSIDVMEDRRLVVLGAPASGKSVLLRKVFVFGALEQHVKSNDCLIPLRVLLIDMGRQIAKCNLTADDDLLKFYLEEKFGSNSSKTLFLKRALLSGRVLLLLDGLDEAGSNQHIVIHWMTNYLKRFYDQRVIISSREVGFSQNAQICAAHGFKVTKVLPLSQESILSVIDKRILSKQVDLRQYLKQQLVMPEYASLARNPMMLSLLIHVLSYMHLSQGNENASSTLSKTASVLSRGKLFAFAIEQMLRRGDAAKYRRRNGIEDKKIQSDFDMLELDQAMWILRQVALVAHSSSNRDISMESFVVAISSVFGEMDVKNMKVVLETLNALQRSIDRNHVPLFERRDSNVDESHGRVVMFTHLTLQEHLAAEGISFELEIIQREAFLKNGPALLFIELASHPEFAAVLNKYFGHKQLENEWWHDVFLSVCDLMQERQMQVVMQAMFYHLFNVGNFDFETQLFKYNVGEETVRKDFGRQVEMENATEEARKKIWLAAASNGNIPFLDMFLGIGSFKVLPCDMRRMEPNTDLEFVRLDLIVDEKGNNVTHLAAAFNRTEYIIRLHDGLKEMAQSFYFPDMVQTHNEIGQDAIHVATVGGNLSICRITKPPPCDLLVANERDEENPDIIRYAKARNISKVEEILKEDVKHVLDAGSSGITAAKWACINNDIDMLQLIHKYNPQSIDPNCARTDLQLEFAVCFNSLKCVEYLLSNGISPETKNASGDSYVVLATAYGYTDVMTALITHGASCAEPLLFLCMQGRKELIKSILKAAPDFDINSLTEIGLPVLVVACMSNHLDVAKFLIQQGAKCDIPFNVTYGITASQLLCKRNAIEGAEFLIQNGACVNTISPPECHTPCHSTPLSLASDCGEEEAADLIALLRSHGAKTYQDMNDEERNKYMGQYVECDPFSR